MDFFSLLQYKLIKEKKILATCIMSRLSFLSKPIVTIVKSNQSVPGTTHTFREHFDTKFVGME